MNPQPISLAHDPDLRLSEDAMRRAAKRACAVARQTGTQLVYCYHGEVLRISPEEQDEVEASWAAEVQRRVESNSLGNAKTYSAEEVLGSYKKTPDEK
ncbi:MAG: hypothetical protein Q8P42_03830 [Gallionella sp.]|nr:hypothetical protein [Gallionella sp.]